MNLVILSGGLDSVVLLHKVLKESEKETVCISFDYGQKHKKELLFAEYWTETFNLGHIVTDLDGLFTKSSLLGDLPMPQNMENMTPTVVPGRNMTFISVAASIAMSDGFSDIYIGTNHDDHAVYPDCRIPFLKGMFESLYTASEGNVYLHYPFARKTKKEIVELGKELNVDFDKTWSCYEGGDEPCGVCGACQVRNEAMK